VLRRIPLYPHGYTRPVPDWNRLRGVILLQRGDTDLVAFAGGTAGTDPDADCTLGTRFQICSVSKQFTAAAVLTLAERGALSVGDAIGHWISGCPASWDAITVHHLLTHTSGLPHWRDIPELDPTALVSFKDGLRILTEAPLLGAPGQRFHYSSPGYVLLGSIVERASGQPYAPFLASEIFGPLGMESTFAGNPDGQPNVTAGHRDGVPAPSFELAAANAGTGDVWSTAPDLARWDRALAAGEILSPASRQAMLTVHAAASDDDPVIRTEGYGYGWYIGSLRGEHPMLYHTGDNPGFRSLNVWFPRDEVRLVLLSNEETTAIGPLMAELIAAAFPGGPG
jgi:CubicO group peptidase (beta-lactamase class C family)